MSKSGELEKQVNDLEFAFQKFAQVCKLIDSPITTHSTIQRFEAAFAAFWHTMCMILESRGLLPDSKPETIQMAHEMQLLQTVSIWSDMLKDVELENTNSGTPLDEYYARIRKIYFPEMNDSLVCIKEKTI